jgi:hypothetical protein
MLPTSTCTAELSFSKIIADSLTQYPTGVVSEAETDDESNEECSEDEESNEGCSEESNAWSELSRMRALGQTSTTGTNVERQGKRQREDSPDRGRTAFRQRGDVRSISVGGSMEGSVGGSVPPRKRDRRSKSVRIKNELFYGKARASVIGQLRLIRVKSN